MEQGVRTTASELCKETGRMVEDPEELIGVRLHVARMAQPFRGIPINGGVGRNDSADESGGQARRAGRAAAPRRWRRPLACGAAVTQHAASRSTLACFER
eukprot:3592730-Rhodomonas_salina.1